MPSDLSTWLIAVPQDGDAEGLLPDLRQKLEYARALPRSNISELAIPTLKVRNRPFYLCYLIDHHVIYIIYIYRPRLSLQLVYGALKWRSKSSLSLHFIHLMLLGRDTR
jgi:hypothetical protein